MARRLIQDTGVLIAAERGKASVDTVIGDADDVAVAAFDDLSGVRAQVVPR